jgi:membrane-bound lytic murein transglycosylase B
MAMRRRTTTIALCIAVAFTACGSDGRSPTPTRAPTVSPDPTPTQTPFSDPFEAARTYDSSSPEELASDLSAAERVLRDGEGDLAAARVQQAAYRQLVRMPAWRETVYRRLSKADAAAARANVRAGAELRAITPPRDDLPPWRIVEPPTAERLLAAYRNAERSLGIGWEYLAAIHLTETRMGRIRGASTAGAEGPMQFLPSTWEAYGEGDINDPDDAIKAAARYLAAHGAPKNMDRALFAYNHSDHYVTAVQIYAEQMRANPDRYHAYHGWQVYYRTSTRGDALLYEGWPSR